MMSVLDLRRLYRRAISARLALTSFSGGRTRGAGGAVTAAAPVSPTMMVCRRSREGLSTRGCPRVVFGGGIGGAASADGRGRHPRLMLVKQDAHESMFNSALLRAPRK
jgi:hypothetical protein